MVDARFRPLFPYPVLQIQQEGCVLIIENISDIADFWQRPEQIVSAFLEITLPNVWGSAWDENLGLTYFYLNPNASPPSLETVLLLCEIFQERYVRCQRCACCYTSVYPGMETYLTISCDICSGRSLICIDLGLRDVLEH